MRRLSEAARGITEPRATIVNARRESPVFPLIAQVSMDGAGLAVHVIHQQILSQGVRSGEIRLSPAQLRHFLNKVDQAVIAREHERIDDDALLLAAIYFLERAADDQRIETKSIP